MSVVDRTPEARRFELAFELFEDGVAITRERLRREHPTESKRQLDERIGAWLHDRPSAPNGDAEGRPIRLTAR